MNQNALREQMKKDGAEIDQMKSSTYYKQCSSCIGKFKQTFKPVLLNCGHFVCSTKQCLQRNYCPQCNKPFKEKIKPYQTLLSYLKFYEQPTENSQRKLYTFVISNIDSTKTKIVSTIPEDTTLEKVIDAFFKYKDDKPKADNFGITIRNYSAIYRDVKDKTIKEYNQFIQKHHPNQEQLASIMNQANEINNIRFMLKWDGGRKS